MRSAKSLMAANYLTGEVKADGMTRYYYNPTRSTLSESISSSGYGTARTSASDWWTGEGTAVGIPNLNGSSPSVLSLIMNADGSIKYFWGGAYAGSNVTSPEELQALSSAERIEKDKLLLDSLQNEFRSMTYGELKQLFLNDQGGRKPTLVYGTIDGYLCVTIANGTINKNSYEVVTGSGKNGIYLQDVFAAAGFDTTLSDNETYVVNSVTGYTNTIWVNLRIRENDLKNLTSSSAKWNQAASNSYTYIKSGGGTTPDPLREVTRKNS